MAEPAVVGDGDLDEVAAALEAGAVVAIPTDTVYGLAARLDRPAALAAVFAAKGRPPGLALPVLVGRWSQVRPVAGRLPRTARLLAARFWPGALTVVVPALPEVGPLLGGDGRSVGLREPDHPFVRALCRRVGPVACTSANRHGEPPCATAGEVASTFGADEVALVVDGGRCEGAPSTVVDCTVSPPACVRAGRLPWSWVEAGLR
ncbi:MAG: L-threonylcarbamoyladenylate synthase [Acidimicrobiales bacterium]